MNGKINKTKCEFMKKFLENYMNCNNMYFIVGIVCVSFIYLYIQQEYILIPLLKEGSLISESLKTQIIAQFAKYRWASFVLYPIFVLLRIVLVGCCLFIGFLFFDAFSRQKIKKCLNIAIKADVILIASPILYTICILFMGADNATYIMKRTSLLGIFDTDAMESFLLIPIGLFNVFEVLYWFFMAAILSVSVNKTYKESMNFVIATYGAGLLLYILIMIFVVLYMSQ